MPCMDSNLSLLIRNKMQDMLRCPCVRAESMAVALVVYPEGGKSSYVVSLSPLK